MKKEYTESSIVIDQETIQEILGIKEKVYTTPNEMADNMNITFFPHVKENASKNIISFSEKLKETFKDLSVNVVPYNESLTKVPLAKSLKSVLKVLVNNLIYSFRHTFGFPQKSLPQNQAC